MRWMSFYGKEFVMHLKIAHRRFEIRIFIALAPVFACEAQVLHDRLDPLPVRIVTEDVIIRHLPHAELGIPVFQEGSLSGMYQICSCSNRTRIFLRSVSIRIFLRMAFIFARVNS